jgi:hypothetical protein
LKNILIAGHPRSGNTFLGYLLSYHFNAPYYDMYDLTNALMRGEDIESLTLSSESFSGTFVRTDQEKQVGAVLKSHELPENLPSKHQTALAYVNYQPSDPLILITREPKDVAVSFFYYTFFRQAFKRRDWSRLLPGPIRHWFYLTFLFEDLALKVARNWNRMVSEWCRFKPLLIRYEDLLNHPQGQIQRVASAFGLGFHDGYANEAARFCELSHLVGLERTRNPDIQESERKYRTGKVGGWAELFPPRLRLKFDALTRKEAQLVGYQG